MCKADSLPAPAFKVFDSFEDADQKQREEWWAMAPGERLILLEKLRMQRYEDPENPPRLEITFEVIDQPW